MALDGGGSLHVADDADHHGHVLVAVRPSAISLHGARAGGQRAQRLARYGRRRRADRRPGARSAWTAPRRVVVDVTPAAVADLDLTRGSEVWLSAKATELDVYPA